MDISDDDGVIRHPRVIIHLDIDCFYAQVESLLHPEYADRPLGVRQKNLVVTCNYIARQFGVKKLMSTDEALLLCPDLCLVCGENLTPYRKISVKINEVLHQFTTQIERLGLDEHFVDVTSMVEHGEDYSKTFVEFADGTKYFNDPQEECPCGCHEKLRIGARIAFEMRKKILENLGLTCSAGIAHNKLLAKLSSSVYKPNGQTVVFPCSAADLVSSTGSLAKIPGIGQKTQELLVKNGIESVLDLRRLSQEELQMRIGKDLARKMKDFCEGIDNSIVKTSGKPQTIGLEDGVKKISLIHDVESRLSALLRRLMELAAEDGRIPVAMRLTVRKLDPKKPNSGKREYRQCSMPPHLTPFGKGGGGNYEHAKILALTMKLFHRAVNVSKPFHLTLLGLAFTKFEDKVTGKSITSFLRKQVAVQSVLNISSEDGISDCSLGSPMSINQDSSDSCETPSKCSAESRSSRFANSDQTDEDDISNEMEPSPKKTKLGVWLHGRKESPSNEMAGLRLSPSSPMSTTPSRSESMVLKSLKSETPRSWSSGNKSKPSNIYKFFIANK